MFSSETMNRKGKGLTKEALDMLCQLARSESDRCLINYSISKSQSLSAQEATKKYCFTDLHCKEDMIMKAAEQSKDIRDAVMKLASVRNKATLRILVMSYLVVAVTPRTATLINWSLKVTCL